jgi:integrase
MNLSHMEISFWRHKGKKNGRSKLYCRISVAGERTDIGSTGISIYHEYWNGERVMDEDPEAFFKNERLNIIRNQLMAVYNDLFRRKEKITAAKIKRFYLGQTGNVPLLTAFQMYIKDCQIDPERELESSSVMVYNNVRKKITTFLIEQRATDVLAEDFDLLWLKKYRRWMKTVPLDAGKTGHADSYVAKHSQTISSMLIWARLHKLIDVNPLQGLRVKGATFEEPVFLTEDQFQLLRSHAFKSQKLQETADVLVIMCRSGFHYGDLLDMAKRYKVSLRQGLDGEPWLVKDRIKTQVKIHVPVFNEVQQIVDKYGGWEKLPLRPLAKFNEFLKLVAAELDLPDDLSSKAGRKTFTDWCFNSLLLSTDTVKILLGRKSDKGLEVYGRPDERRVIAELSQSQEMQRRKERVE